MNAEEMREILACVAVPEFEFHVVEERFLRDNGHFKPTPVVSYHLQGTYVEGDIVTGDRMDQHTRKWRLSTHMTKSELVQTAFKCYLTSMEHRAREGFTYKGRRIFGPHFDVDALVELCLDRNLDYRRPA